MELVKKMRIALAFVEEATRNVPKKLKSLDTVATTLVRETGECCAFVRQHIHKEGGLVGTRFQGSNLPGMLIANLLERADQPSSKVVKGIEYFKVKFEELLNELHTIMSLITSESV